MAGLKCDCGEIIDYNEYFTHQEHCAATMKPAVPELDSLAEEAEPKYVNKWKMKEERLYEPMDEPKVKYIKKKEQTGFIRQEATPETIEAFMIG